MGGKNIMKAKIAVVIPVYNAEKFLKRGINSNPIKSLCDSEQTINLSELKQIIDFNKIKI